MLRDTSSYAVSSMDSTSSIWRRTRCFVSRSRCRSIFGVGVVDRRHIQPEQWAAWRGSYGPGAEPLDALIAAWERIVPGYWLVDVYWDSEETSWSGPRGPGYEGLVLGSEVGCEIWT